MPILRFRRMSVFLALLVTVLTLIPSAFAQTANTVELVGAVERMSVNTITVNQQSINIHSAEINTVLEIGTIVRIEGTLDQDGTIIAQQINLVVSGLQPGEAELVGVLQSFNGTTMVVNGQSLDVSAAEINSGVEVGQTVKVRATGTNANTWQAREVESFQSGATTTQPPLDDGFEITGTLENIGSGNIVVAGQTISIIGAEIKDPLLLGTLIRVRARIVNQQMAAREIQNARTGEDDNTNANNNSNNNLNGNDNSNNENENANENNNSNDNSNAGAAISAQQAIDIVLQVYPTTTIRSVELTTKFGGRLVWEVKIGGGIEVTVDAQTGAILTIDRPGDDDNQNQNTNNNQNRNGNDNSDDDGNDNRDDSDGRGSDDNGNQNENSNDNSDDSGNDDNGGMGSDDNGSDDNGSDDNGSDDNDGMG